MSILNLITVTLHSAIENAPKTKKSSKHVEICEILQFFHFANKFLTNLECRKIKNDVANLFSLTNHFNFFDLLCNSLTNLKFLDFLQFYLFLEQFLNERKVQILIRTAISKHKNTLKFNYKSYE